MQHRYRTKTAPERELAALAAERPDYHRLGYVALALEVPPGYLLHRSDRTVGDASRNRTEETFELVRRNLFPDRPSRYTCNYAAPTIEAARSWRRRRPYIYAAALSGNIFAANSELWTLAIEYSDRPDRVVEIASTYWSGTLGYPTLVELLVDGDVSILERLE